MSRRLYLLALLFLVAGASHWFFDAATRAYGLNVLTYMDTISDSKPGEYSNHTLSFVLNTDIAPGGYLELTPPLGFTVPAASFGVRNVELRVNGTPRVATSTVSGTDDGVTITTGSPGNIRYDLNTTSGLFTGDHIEFRIGDHTTNAVIGSVNYSSSTGTTTIAGDVGIQNSTATGTHRFSLRTGGGLAAAFADFLIAIVEGVGILNVDTTEIIPPYRFNGAPSGTIGGTTLGVEISLETDEFAYCKYSTSPDVEYDDMTHFFETTGLLIHILEIAVTNDTTYNFYVRCIDDESNENVDDYVITFTVPPPPDGDINEEGDEQGDGTGSGNSDADGGTGTGGGSAGGSGGSGGSSSGGGGGGSGSGGGGGGSAGDRNEDESGGAIGNPDAYESGDAQVIVNGYAFPGSKVYVLVDGYAAENGNASGDGSFSVTIDAIARGAYTFGVYAVDAKGVRSSTFSTTFSVQGARTSNLSNINLMPSIKVAPNPVDPGQQLVVSGYAIANSTITIDNGKQGSSASQKTFTTASGSNGAWSLTIDTSGFSPGTYQVRAKSSREGGPTSGFSGYTTYGVGQAAATGNNADLNRDGKVNLTDFSILLFWWNSDGGNSNPPADMNQDGRVSLTDFSIMLFNWTG